MTIYLFILLISFFFNFSLIIPFIDLLYQLKFQRANQQTKDAFDQRTPIFDRFHKKKAGTPVGGGIFLIFTTVALFSLFLFLFNFFRKPITSNYSAVGKEIQVLLFTFVSFSFLGLYDDLKKIFFWKKTKFFGLSLSSKLILEVVLGVIISFWLYFDLKIDLINIPFFGFYHLGWWYIPFATFVIIAFANAINITDGLDGLASGILLISLMVFWIISRSIVDTPISLFIAIWLGGIIAFLYFNTYPARIFLGDSGALSFGASFAVIGLLLGKVFVLPIIGGFFVLEIFTSLIQLLSKKIRRRKFFPVAPFHLWLQLKGWEEPKIVMRAWIISLILALFGLMIALLK